MTGCLLLGRADLLSGGPPLRDDDVITLAQPATTGPAAGANTVVLRWADLGPLDLTVQTVDGRHRLHGRCAGGDLFDALRPGPALTDLTTQMAPTISPPALLFYITTPPGQTGLRVYSRVDLSEHDACLLYLDTLPTSDPPDRLDWLPAALDAHHDQAASLNSHQCAWRKGFPGHEVEYKYTLPTCTDIWNLATDTHRRILTGHLPGFVLKHHDGFQTWDYLNHLFDIHAPAAERGYVSFIPSITTPGWRMKRKWFTHDTLTRREQLTDLPPITGSLATYVADTLQAQARQMPTFRRIRYDINIESLATGHYYGIFYDRCQLTANPDITLYQCEIEYCRTRTIRPPDEDEIMRELQFVAAFSEGVHADHHLAVPRSYYSKLSFLRAATTSEQAHR